MKRGFIAQVILCVLALLPLHVWAQAPTAAFTANNTSGCSPVVVQFTDQSTGNPTSWSWDLGNGGSSTLQNPGATYITPGTYRVILTATNSNGSTKDTAFITVYAAPSIAFSTDTTDACGTKTVTFSNTTNPNAAGAVTYQWDFGDGDSSTVMSPTHTYNTAGTFTVTLVVTNSNGCTNTLTKTNYITVKAAPTANFTTANTASCSAPFNVSFTNSSIAASAYSWTFGDGNSSTATNPSNNYTSSGSYNVTLIATDTAGCTDTLTKNAYINVGTVNAGFTSSGPYCRGQQISFTNTTSPGPGTSIWDYGDASGLDTITNGLHAYANSGTYTVTLVEVYSNCNDTTTAVVNINNNPSLSFTTTDTIGCTVPFNATFTNTSLGTNTYLWNFGDGNSSTATSPTHTYTSTGIYNVQLIGTNAAGCSTSYTLNNIVKLQQPSGSLQLAPATVCPGETVQFSATVNAPFFATNYSWDFGDGNSTSCTSCSAIAHTYATAGSYTVRLIYNTSSSCTDTLQTFVTVNTKPTANFTGTPLSICPGGNVTFTNTSTNATTYLWGFDDGSTSTATNPIHGFPSTGDYTITLIANNGGCKDTLVRSSYVTVELPEAKFGASYTCANRLAYTFTDSSIGANTYSWNFGDGNTSTTSGTVTHTYAAPGTYPVSLTVTNTSNGCNHVYTDTIVISSLLASDFTVSDTTTCQGQTITFQRTNATEPGLYYTWVLSGTRYPWQGKNNFQNGILPPGSHTIKLVVSDSAGCADSVVKTNYIKVGGFNMDFTANKVTACRLEKIIFDDNTVPGAFPIVNWYWDFDDNTDANRSNDTVSHVFNNNKTYHIKLAVTDANGCTDTLVKQNFIETHSPTANFYTNDTIVCAGDTIDFVNNSGGSSFTALWDFGDGTTSTVVDPPNKTYATTGNYTVKLTITDAYGCLDSLIKVDYISVQKPTAAFTMSDSVAACPPLTVYFTNNSTLSSTHAWTFGNNTQSNLTNPSTTYTYPGIYTVKLVAVNVAGCKDSTTKNVTINGPTGTVSYSPTSGCSPVTVNFTATANNTASYIWDLNNGYSQTTSSGTFSYTYTSAGVFVPNLILSDGGSCQVPLQLNDTVYVDTMSADFTFTAAGTLCNTDTIYFDDTIVTSYTSVADREWDFGDGTYSTAEDPSHYYSLPGNYTVSLIVSNTTGCKDTITKVVTINQLPTVNITASDDSICPGQPTGALLTATGASTYIWTPATGLSCTNCSNPNANPPGSTTYTVIGTDTNGCVDTTTQIIVVNPKPAISVSNNVIICTGASTQLQATGATTYTWTPTTGLSCTNCANPVASPSATDTFTAIGANIYGCTDTGSVIVTVITKPVVSAGSNQTICAGDTATLIATGANNYTWTPTGTLSCSSCDTTQAFPATTTVYTVIGVAGNNCADTADVTVNVNPLPTISAGTDKTICIGSSTSLTATGGTSYTWTPATALSCTNCASPTASPTTTTTYTVVGTDGNSCSDTDQVVVNVNPLPTISAGSDKTICVGFSATLTATGGTSYSWSPAAGLSCTSCASPSASPAITTSYVVTGTDANGCSNTDTVVVTVNPQPTVSTTGDQTICNGDSVLLVATGAVTYEWSPGATLSCTACDSTYASPTVTTIYTVIGTDANTCNDTVDVTVTVNPLPNINAGTDKTICTGSSTTLTATGGTSYTWTPATALSCTNCASPTASPTTTTTYTVVGIDGNSCSDTDQVVVNVNPLPTISAGTDKTICVGFSTTLTATGGTSYSWSPATGLSCTNCASPTASPATTTTYIVTGTDANGCSNTDTIVVNVNAQPVVSGGSNQTICTGNSTPLTATGATSYSWSPATGLSCTNCANPTASPTTTTTYTVIGTDVNGCKDTATVTVTVSPLPTINAGADQSICIGASASLSASGGTTYSWSPATGLSCTNCANPTASPTTTTTYTVTGTNAGGCSNTDQITITVNPLPSINAGSDNSVCLDDSVQLNATGGTSYVWSPATGLGCTNCANPKASPAANTTYTVTGTDANGCVNTDQVNISVKTLPSVSAGGDKAVCIGSSGVLQASGASTYSWTPATALSCTNCQAPTASPTTNTSYIVTGTATNGCIGKDTAVVTVNPLPTISAGPTESVCLNDSLLLTATGGVSYVWSPANGLGCTNCANPRTSPSNDITYTIIGTDANGCVNTATKTVTIDTLPIVELTASRYLLCARDTVQLNATGGITYNWTPNFGLSCLNCADPVASPLGTTRYVVTGFNANNCRDTASVLINANPLPNVVASKDVEFCVGGSDTLKATGAATYTWTPSTSLSCTSCAVTIASPATTTTYTVTGTDTNGCTKTDDVTAIVNQPPAISAGDDRSICDGSSTTLQATGGVSYTWSPAVGLSCTTCPVTVANVNGNITYTVVGIDSNGCSGSDDVAISIIEKGDISYGNDDSICIGQETTLFASGGSSYTWFPTDGLTSPNSANPTASPATTTTYNVVIKQGDCFTDTGEVKVSVFNYPTVNAGSDETILGGDGIKLQTVATDGVSYEWSPATGLSCTDCANPIATPTRPTTYTVKVTSGIGCEAQDDVTIYVTCGLEQLFVANTFTPNGDGVNDRFFPQGKGVKIVRRFTIYSRWGEIIYDAQNIPLNDPQYGWDGTYKREPLKPDVFVYILKAECETGEPLEIKGDISLVR